eukprot:233387_1
MSDTNRFFQPNHVNDSSKSPSLESPWSGSNHDVLPSNSNAFKCHDGDQGDMNMNGNHQASFDSNRNNKNTDKKRLHRSFDDDTHNTFDFHRTPSKKIKVSDPTDQLPTWPCPLCTFSNRLKDDRCHICAAYKPSSKPASQRNSSTHNHAIEEDNNISKLINGLQNVRLNANHSNQNDQTHPNPLANAANDDAMDSMDGIIGKLQSLQFDEKANAAINESSKMNDIIDTLSHLDMNQSHPKDIHRMVKDINREVNQFIIDLQNQLYWKFKIKKESSKFRKMPHQHSIDRISRILTFYDDHHTEEYSLFQFVNDQESDYKHLQSDYQHIITDNVVSNDPVIKMKKVFGLYCDYIAQTLPKCGDTEQCLILQRYRDEDDEDDDIFDDKLSDLKSKMDVMHCYLFHTESCGIAIDTQNECKQLAFGGEWYWFYDDLDIKWIPYKRTDQLKLNNAWRNNVDELVIVLDGRYKVQFKRNSNNSNPCGWQYDDRKSNGWRRRVIYGTRDRDGLLNGIVCEKQPIVM